ncbi:MAG: DNA polymerase clamp loader subunit A [Patescibacteria group bacterium]|nr:DNA polymerase clamp loader subunit A [Patescibacteria group bacterium]
MWVEQTMSNQLTPILRAINKKSEGPSFINRMNEEDYPPFVVNRIFSNFPDTLFHAHAMNRYPRLDRDLQYKYLYYAISQKSRFCPIIKTKLLSEEVLDDIEKKYNISKKSIMKNYSGLIRFMLEVENTYDKNI